MPTDRQTSPLFPGNLLAFLAGLRESDRDGLLAAFHLAAFAAATALRLAPLVAMHLVLHVLARAAGVLALPLLCHVELRWRASLLLRQLVGHILVMLQRRNGF